MNIRFSFAHALAITLDCIGAFFLSLYALIIGPLGFLRGPIVLERTFWYIWVLAPQGLLTRAIRIAIDWRLGHFDVAIVQTESLISQLEPSLHNKGRKRFFRRVLLDLYSVLARAYLHKGHIDEAMLVIIRAHKNLRIDRLIGLSGIDVKTANLIRAGMAAGKLLDGSGLATMFVKSTPPQTNTQSPKQKQTQNEAKNPPSPSMKTKPTEHQGKVIPFPPPPEHSPLN